MAVVHELACSKDGRHELGPVHNRVQTALEQLDQVFAGVAFAADGFGVVLAELLLGDVAVVALKLLFGLELQTEVGIFLLATLTMLAGTVGTLVDRGLGATPQVDAQAAVNLVLRRNAL